MSADKLESFKLRLEELKEQGIDVNPDNIVNEVIIESKRHAEEQAKEEKDAEDEKFFIMVKSKIDDILDDYFNHYRPKGRKLKVMLEVVKENCADKYGEKFTYSDNFQVISVIGIGTKRGE